MSRTHLFFKVEVEHDAGENPQRLGEEICRQIQRVYGVRLAELSSLTKVEE
jgi:tetrahydromethanopterin S-methyltransferase subunit G